MSDVILLLRLKDASPQALGSPQIQLGPLPADLELAPLRGQNHLSHHPLPSQDWRPPCTSAHWQGIGGMDLSQGN